jgi:hypothetical protein
MTIYNQKIYRKPNFSINMEKINLGDEDASVVLDAGSVT